MKHSARIFLLPTLLLAACASSSHGGAKTFETPDSAVRALTDAAAAGDLDALDAILGPGGRNLVASDDPAEDQSIDHARELLAEKLAFEKRPDGSTVALFGNESWPMPIPLVESDGRWQFDSEAGRDELLSRRIGRNELETLATLHAYVDAQREYASVGRDGAEPAFARRLLSTPGKHDGLYWPASGNDEESPFGPLVAEAAQDGYRKETAGETPFHGYYYRILERQGSNAPGGARLYVDTTGRMTRGFAMIAWPARYASSGVMTFLVGPQGIVYQKDLGDGTEAEAAKILTFDPDGSWDPTED